MEESLMATLITRSFSVPPSVSTRVFPRVNRAVRRLGRQNGVVSNVDVNNTLTSPSHGLEDDQKVRILSSGSLPAGLAKGTLYYVINSTADTFQASASSGGSAVDLTDKGDGEITFEDADENDFGWLYYEADSAKAATVRVDYTDGAYDTGAVLARYDGVDSEFGNTASQYPSDADAFVVDPEEPGWMVVSKTSPLTVSGDRNLRRLRLSAIGESNIIVVVELQIQGIPR